MIFIRKRKHTPAVFREAKNSFEDYEELSTGIKRQMKAFLIREQGGLCAYCMSRITLDTATIEHYLPQSKAPDKTLDYRNLLAVCNNGRNERGKVRHCDVTRGNRELHIDPCRENDIKHISYKRNGTIFGDSEEIDRDLNIILNLNNATLKNNRKAALNTAFDILKRKNKGIWTKDYLEQCLENIREQKEKTPYAGIIIYELEKRLRRDTY